MLSARSISEAAIPEEDVSDDDIGCGKVQREDLKVLMTEEFVCRNVAEALMS